MEYRWPIRFLYERSQAVYIYLMGPLTFYTWTCTNFDSNFLYNIYNYIVCTYPCHYWVSQNLQFIVQLIKYTVNLYLSRCSTDLMDTQYYMDPVPLKRLPQILHWRFNGIVSSSEIRFTFNVVIFSIPVADTIDFMVLRIGPIAQWLLQEHIFNWSVPPLNITLNVHHISEMKTVQWGWIVP